MKTTDRKRQFEELLPWYVNATLGKEDYDMVEQYLAEHPESGQDLRFAQTLRKRIRENAESLSPDAGLDKLMSRIRGDRQKRQVQTPVASVFEKLGAYFSGFALRPAYVVAACVILVQAGVIGSLLQEVRQGERDAKRFSEYRSQPAEKPLEY